MSNGYIQFVLIGVLALSLSLLLYLTGEWIYKTFIVQTLKNALKSDQKTILEYHYDEKSFFGRFKLFANLHSDIRKAGWSIGDFLFIFIAVTVGVVFGVLLFVLISNILAAAVGFAFGWYIPFYILNFIISKRRREFNVALAGMISMLVRMMRNGIGFDQAQKRAIEASDSALFRAIFAKFLHEKDIVGESKAFESISKVIDSAELKIFAMSVIIGRSSGGKFSNTLEKLEESINSRLKLQRKIDVATREAVIGSYLIVAILAIIYVMMDVSFEGRMSGYFFQNPKGKIEFMLTLLWVGLGLFLNSKLTKIR